MSVKSTDKLPLRAQTKNKKQQQLRRRNIKGYNIWE